MKNAIIFCTNEGYMDCFYMFLRSIKESAINRKGDVEYIAFFDTEYTRSLAKKSPDFGWLSDTVVLNTGRDDYERSGDELFNPNVVQGMSLRIHAFKWLQDNGYNRALYLDVDMVVQDSLEDVFELNQSTAILGVPEMRYPLTLAYTQNDSCAVFWAKRGMFMTDLHDYVNSGALLVDLDIMKTEHADIVKLYLENVSRYTCPDQDFLNEVFTVSPTLPREYNGMAEFDLVSSMSDADRLARRDENSLCKVIHYHCQAKPWRFDVSKWDIYVMQVPCEPVYEIVDQLGSLLSKNFVYNVNSTRKEAEY